MIVVVDLAALGDRGRERASPDFVIVIVTDHDRPSRNPAKPGHPSLKPAAGGSRPRNRSAKPAFTITITKTWIRHGSFCELSCESAAHKLTRLARAAACGVCAGAWRGRARSVRLRNHF